MLELSLFKLLEYIEWNLRENLGSAKLLIYLIAFLFLCYRSMPNEIPLDGWILFGDVAMDVVGRRLFINERVVLLEPKAFAVLILLARNSGQLVTRDAILDAVWGHRHVTTSVLHRVMTLIRQALGAEGREHQYVSTVYGLGYRLDAFVQFAATRPNLLDKALASTEQNADSRLLASPETGNLTSARPSTEHAQRPFRYARPIGWLVVSVSFLIVLVVWGLHQGSTSANTKSTVSPALVVVPLRAVGDDKDESIFAEGLSEELITQLARVEGLRLISSTSAARAEKENLDPVQLARRLHVTHALEGSLRQAGDDLRIDLRLIAVPSGDTLWAQGYDRKLADVFSVQQEISRAVATELALNIGLTNQPPVRVDPQIFREYLRLRSIVHNAIRDTDVQDALPAMRSLVARAPNYAAAHGVLALTLATGQLTPDAESESLREAQRTLELDPDSLDGHAALAQRACQRTEWTECMNQLRIVHTLSPADSLTHLMHGIFLAELGYREEALEQFETANAADPLNYWASFNCGQALDILGRHEDAKHYFDQLPSLETKHNIVTDVVRWRNAIWRKDYIHAKLFAANMPDESGRRTAYLAVTSALMDETRWPAANDAIASLERETGEISWLRFEEPRLQISTVISLVETDMRAFDMDAMMMWAPEYAQLHRAAAFDDLLRRLRMPAYWAENGWPPQCSAQGTHAHCE
jgi:TolB-like protein/DNA-binding winged helix-turn-helix (wHTH) protein/Tfp pilus assembly protein PilF